MHYFFPNSKLIIKYIFLGNFGGIFKFCRGANCIEIFAAFSQLNSTSITGLDAGIQLLTEKDGGVWFDPLPGDLVRTVHGKPQVKLKLEFFHLFIVKKMHIYLLSLCLVIHLYHLLNYLELLSLNFYICKLICLEDIVSLKYHFKCIGAGDHQQCSISVLWELQLSVD